jgi:catechol 2,3-dioxygenase-like lactoylglutathione lyase family enzyme
VTSVRRIARIHLICSDAARIASFYQAALGFVPSPDVAVSASTRTVDLRLGDQTIVLTDSGPHGRRYPPDIDSASLLFQHFAIVVGDMATAYAQLSRQTGWTPISTGGPQRLPASSGGVTAFKFRDPDGHPHELLAFPTPARTGKIFQGIDHSALSVTDTARSLAFYQSLSLTVAGGSINQGPEQDRLDGLSGVRVEVTPLALPDHSSPHVELLCYSQGRASAPAALDDIASTRLVFAVETTPDLQSLCNSHVDALVSGPEEVSGHVVRATMRDPDGHLIVLEAPMAGNAK